MFGKLKGGGCEGTASVRHNPPLHSSTGLVIRLGASDLCGHSRQSENTPLPLVFHMLAPSPSHSRGMACTQFLTSDLLSGLRVVNPETAPRRVTTATTPSVDFHGERGLIGGGLRRRVLAPGKDRDELQSSIDQDTGVNEGVRV